MEQMYESMWFFVVVSCKTLNSVEQGYAAKEGELLAIRETLWVGSVYLHEEHFTI